MKIELKDGDSISTIDTTCDVTVEKIFNGITIKTREGKKLNICLRDFGFDMSIDGGEWFHIHDEEDICCLKCQRKNKLDKINNI